MTAIFLENNLNYFHRAPRPPGAVVFRATRDYRIRITLWPNGESAVSYTQLMIEGERNEAQAIISSHFVACQRDASK